MTHVFISYVHEDSASVDRLCDGLEASGIRIWRDRDRILPGQRWQDAIRSAINDGAFFVACFSEAYLNKRSSYMNEELLIAIEQLRRMPTDRIWFIPVLLSACKPPDRRIGGGESLRDLQWVALYENWELGIHRISKVMSANIADKPTDSNVSKLLETIINAKRKRARSLDLSNRNIVNLPPDIGELTELEVLNLSFNKLADFPSEMQNLKSLRILYMNTDALQQRQVFRLPQVLCSLYGLEELYLNGLMLIDLPRDIGRLQNLRVLYCGKREISTCKRCNTAEVQSWATYQLSSLTNISDLPKSLFELSKLEILDLSGNSLKQVPEEIIKLNKLKILDLYQNKLSSFPDIDSLKYIEELVLVQNPVPVPEDVLNNVSNPKEICKYLCN